MLKSRIATALVIAPLTLAAVFFLPPQVFSLFIALIVLMAGWEWTAMMRLVSRSQRTVYVLSLLFAIVAVQKALPHFEEGYIFSDRCLVGAGHRSSLPVPKSECALVW